MLHSVTLTLSKTKLSQCHRRFLTLARQSFEARNKHQYCCAHLDRKKIFVQKHVTASRNYNSSTTHEVDASLVNWGAEGNEYDPLDTEDASDKHKHLTGFGDPLITKYNVKWMTRKNKKKKKEKRVKVPMDYQDIRESTFNELMSTFPQVAELNPLAVQQMMATLSSLYGFSPTKVAKMLSRYPQLLENYIDVVPAAVKTWRTLGFLENDRVSIFVKNPQLMNVPADILYERYNFLKQYFSNRELVKLIANNPMALAIDETLINEKINLLWKTYSHSTLAIASCQVISYDSIQISVRHEFLIRTGFFKPVPFHKFLKLQATEDWKRITVVRPNYILPSDIVCSSDDKFIRVCTKGSLNTEELATFEELYKKEMEERQYFELQQLDGDDDEQDEEIESSTNYMTDKGRKDSDEDKEQDYEFDEDEASKQVVITENRYRVRNSSDALDAKEFYF